MDQDRLVILISQILLCIFLIFFSLLFDIIIEVYRLLKEHDDYLQDLHKVRYVTPVY